MTTDATPTASPETDPRNWAAGEEPATGAQLSYLQSLARAAGEEVPDRISKADASLRIDELQARSGRGVA